MEVTEGRGYKPEKCCVKTGIGSRDRRVEREMEVFFLIKEITKSILSASSIKEKSKRVYEFMKGKYGECTVGIAVNDIKSQRLCDCFYYENDECLDFEDVLYAERGTSKLLKAVLTKEEGVYDLHNREKVISFVGMVPTASYFAPLLMEGEAIGAFTFQIYDRGCFSEEEIEVCRELIPFMTIALNNTIQATAIVEANKKLEWFSKYDEVTGIYNRRFFYEAFNEVYEDALISQEETYLYLLDLDNFKGVNDNFGHSAGDKALKDFAHILRDVFKGGETGRYGGDEFLCGMAGVDQEQVIALAKEVIKRVDELGIHYNDVGGRVTTSIGILKLSKQKALREYFSDLDENLYRAKKEEGNTLFIS